MSRNARSRLVLRSIRLGLLAVVMAVSAAGCGVVGRSSVKAVQLGGLALGARHISAASGELRVATGPLPMNDSYTLFDASAIYKLTPQVTLAIYAQNLLNEEYTATCDSATSCYLGLERNLMTSVKYSW